VTVDVQTVGDRERGETGDQRVTIRERDTMEQVRVPVAELVTVFRELLDGAPWREVSKRYPAPVAKASGP
jgi:glycyl-tRNA synthetase (class II)